MGAILLGETIGQLAPGIHGSTFGGNPLACAVARETLKIIHDENLVENAANMGHLLQQKLSEIPSPLIREVRGMGLLVGIQLKQKVAPFIKKLTEEGILALPAGMTVLRFLPPLVISEEQVDQVADTVKKVLLED